jgi:hypothetical protein
VTVGTAHEDGVFTIGFNAEDGRVLLVSQSDGIDEQDSLGGMDTYALSTEGGATVYGGVEAAQLEGTRLELRLSAESAAELGLPTKLRLRFADETATDDARAGLRRVGIATSDA